MIWQDLVIMIVNIALGYALIPQIIDSFKTKKCEVTVQTSAVSSISLYVMAIAVLTLNLYLSAIITLLDAILWTILLFQKLTYK
jgi:hypothetical protein